MRCLSLAKELRDSGAKVEFISRNHPGNISQKIDNKGFKVNLLINSIIDKQQNLIGYEEWLGVNPDIDADETIKILKNKNFSSGNYSCNLINEIN